MSAKLPDSEAICHVLKTTRKYQRENFKRKTITNPLFSELECLVFSRLHLSYNKVTKNFSFSCCLNWKNKEISVTNNNHLTCLNYAGLNKLDKQRNERFHKTLTAFLFKEKGKQISLVLHCEVNKNTNHINLTHSLKYCRKSICPSVGSKGKCNVTACLTEESYFIWGKDNPEIFNKFINEEV